MPVSSEPIVVTLPPDIEPVRCEELDRRGITMDVLRLDRIHPLLHGNKWFKLKYNLERIRELGNPTVLSFGGAWSNHLRALAAAGRLFGFKTIGLVRGELPATPNPSLAFAAEQGMELQPVSRAAYRLRSQPEFLAGLRERFGEFYLLPEGGSNELALRGCRELAGCIPADTRAGPTVLMLPCGTGLTLAGLLQGLALDHIPIEQVIGVAVLKGEGYLHGEVSRWLGDTELPLPRWQITEEFHCGGYARTDAALAGFLARLPGITPIDVEPVYSGKLFLAAFQLAARGAFPAGTRLLLLHTGGILPVNGEA